MAAQKQEAQRTPHFMWCQDMDRLLLRIEISGVKIEETKLDITRDTFLFQWKNYELKFAFRFPVNPKTVKYRATRLLELVIEKETSNAYWPHLLPKADKKKLKAQCKVDWDRFMDEDDAKKRQKGIVNDDDEYGNLANMGMGGEESSGDDSDDQPIDDLEVSNDAAPKKEDAKVEEEEDEEMPPLENEQDAQSEPKDAEKAKKDEQDDDNKDAKEKAKEAEPDKAAQPAHEEETTVDID